MFSKFHLRVTPLSFCVFLVLSISSACTENPIVPDAEQGGATTNAPVPLLAFSATPLNDMGEGSDYLGYEGGLYPGISSNPPSVHETEGISRGNSVAPLDAFGNPDPSGKYVMISIGMSNTTQEFCSKAGIPPCDPGSFMDKAVNDPDVNQESLVIVNGAKGGQSAEEWLDPSKLNSILRRLDNAGVTEAQVQVAWVKVANRAPTLALPDPAADAFVLEGRMAQIARNLYDRYPNLQQVFFSSRLFAGYAATTLNPEPYAYESGFAVKWLVEAQIDQMETGIVDAESGDLHYATAAPWLAWGPYMWADGLNPRSDGLIWESTDFESDGTHPSAAGVEKVGTALLEFFKSSPFTACWFVTGGICETSTTNAPPTSAFTWTATDLSVQFTDGSMDADGQIVSWAWDFGDGSTSTEQSPLHVYTAAGDYTVSLTVTDDLGLSQQSMHTITVDSGGNPPSITLTSTPIVKNDQRRIRLVWSDATGVNVDVLLDGVVETTTPNDGRYTLRLSDTTMGDTFVTQICEEGSTTECSAEVTVQF